MSEKMKSIIAEQLISMRQKSHWSQASRMILNADSLDLFEMVMALEDNYGVEILLRI